MRILPGPLSPTIVAANKVHFWNFVSLEVGGSIIRYTDKAEGDYTTDGSASFSDVPETDPFFYYVESAYRNGITSGCGGGNFCPTMAIDRKEMAVWLLRAKHGPAYAPPACTGIFGDVTCPSTYAAWIEELYNEGITAGCGSGNYCPDTAVTRAQMAVFILKTLEGSTYTPPAATGTVFGDVGSGDFAAAYIEDLYNRGISAGCGGGNYCPTSNITREQMAVYVTRAFKLTANLNIDGTNSTWTAFDFVLNGPVQSQASPLDVSSISFQNVDNTWSDHVLIDGVRGSRITIYQGWFDDDDNFIGAMKIFDGRLDDGQIGQRAQFSIIPYATPWTTVVPGRTFTPTCQYVFKDKLTCQYAGSDASCLKTIDDCRSRTGGSNEAHFGGFIELPPQNFKYIWGDVQVTPPPTDRQDAQVTFTPQVLPPTRMRAPWPVEGDTDPRPRYDFSV